MSRSVQREAAAEFLRGVLASGPVFSAELVHAAERHGIRETTLRRARRDLGVVALKNSDAWTAHLPRAAR